MDGVDDGVGGGVVVHVGGVDDVVAVWCVFKRQQRVLLHKNDRQCQGFGKGVGKEIPGKGHTQGRIGSWRCWSEGANGGSDPGTSGFPLREDDTGMHLLAGRAEGKVG